MPKLTSSEDRTTCTSILHFIKWNTSGEPYPVCKADNRTWIYVRLRLAYKEIIRQPC